MPTAREVLLDTAVSALAARPWGEVRMREVAAAAGVSRQTLHNEFGGKDGLGRALIGRAADDYLAGTDEALGTHAATGQGPVELALWTVRAARGNALVKALLTGFTRWRPRSPLPPRSAPTPYGWSGRRWHGIRRAERSGRTEGRGV
ncbi:MULTISPECIES: helix-turn-helix domain-containing protein [unclassified Streptomyces]|uniref:TetR/AcrR family transcriptional regulator n=1 Tax=unclassified Streptomyces TaxID=2593676 RepID=UPI0001C1BDE4|nr:MULTISPECIES: helix-turn-helix domain-containing protein [unclassified Streptomyces]MYU33449.1 TetR family transcriptional regulator [Streptomyces sp. SID8358]SCD28970.1 transcriptional regulator, TetR family [Streptomyces sp. BpilaLS-43]AEN12275.1 transcriptional regulator, TetR family [Streptomyces sp. SirexAA-E]MYR70292.1 TetR family transcriptional regulator [Streptomyces sp. SID4939]MYS00841.1 TetR family transcriptional regulator [Streptomyces sp. SID4940]